MSILNYSNCSIYYIPQGNLDLVDWQQNAIDSLHRIRKFPILYVTNCSADYQEVFDYYTEYVESIGWDNLISTRSVDNYSTGNVAVLLLFSAIVISSWMLFIVLLLSTHKKPFSIKIANLLYSVSASVILDRTTKMLEREVNLNIEDMAKFEDIILNDLVYMILVLIVQFVTWILWLEIVLHISPTSSQKKIFNTAVLLMLFNTLTLGLGFFYDTDENSISHASSLVIEIFSVISQVAIQVSFAVCMFLYTLKKNVILYNRQTLPLLLITIFFTLTPPLFYVGMRYSRVLHHWAGIYYTFGQVISAALIWEWILDIEMIEREIELRGIVGREVDTGLDKANNNENDGGVDLRGYKFWKRSKSIAGTEIETNDGEYELNNLSIYSSGNYDDYSYEYEERSYDRDSADASSHFQGSTNNIISIGSVGSSNSLQGQSFNVRNNNEIVDPNAYLDEDESNQDDPLLLPPEFEHHPNFQPGDYWHDEKGHIA